MSLTKPPQQPPFHGAPSAAKAHSIFTVSAAGEKLGLPVSCVQTIFRISRITPIPLGPPEVVGLVNLRGGGNELRIGDHGIDSCSTWTAGRKRDLRLNASLRRHYPNQVPRVFSHPPVKCRQDP